MDTTREWELPSGSEVESAALHPPLHEVSRGGLRGRLDTLKGRGISKVHDIQRVVADRRSTLQSNAKSQVTRLQSNAKSQVEKLQSDAKLQVDRMQGSMRTSPMKWAGIAAGTGFALGLVGRIAQIRSKRRNQTPTLVIVEAGC